MWDVIWTDPDRELVGEHRARKEKRKPEKLVKRRSSSTKRSSASSSDSPFAFLRPQNLKRLQTSEASSNAPSTSSSWLASPTFSSPASPHSPTFDFPIHPSTNHIGDRPLTSSKIHEMRSLPFSHQDDALSQATSRHDSVFSKHGGSDVETTDSTRDCSSHEYDRKKETAHLHRKSAQHLPDSTYNLSPPRPRQSRRASHSVNSSRNIYGSYSPKSSLDLSPSATEEQRRLTNALLLIPGAVAAPNTANLKLDNTNSWKKLGDRDGADRRRETTSTDRPRPALIRTAPSTDHLFDLGAWTRDISWMSAQPVANILKRLKSPEAAARDAEGVETLGPPMHRWMLWSLDHLDPVPESSKLLPKDVNAMSKASNCLSLYDSRETAMYLASLYPSKKIYHMSPNPLSTNIAKNVRPIPVTPQSPLKLPKDDRFESAFSLCLPSMCPAAEIPDLLKAVSGCLKTGAALRLVLIDPVPRIGTYGPHMRAWLRENLLSSLERNFRCTKPCKSFPQWLGDAGLRGPNSSRTVTKFFAVPSCVQDYNNESMGVGGAKKEPSVMDKLTKAEIRSYLGRELWKEVWGSFVTGTEMWWDDPDCVAECIQLGTIWEYQFIEGVRGI